MRDLTQTWKVKEGHLDWDHGAEITYVLLAVVLQVPVWCLAHSSLLSKYLWNE